MFFGTCCLNIYKICILKFFRLLPFDLHQFRFEDQCRSAGNLVPSSGTAVAQLRRDNQLALLALAHTEQSLVPSLDHLSAAQREGQRLATRNTAVEFSAILEGSLYYFCCCWVKLFYNKKSMMHLPCSAYAQDLPCAI